MSTEDFLLSILRGAATPWPESAGPAFEEAFLAESREHAVQPLLHALLGQAQIAPRYPATVCAAIARARMSQAAIEMCRQPELTRVLDTLAEDSVAAIVIKGSALAYTTYPLPELRPRCDTDLLIDRHHLDSASATLRKLGYTEALGVTGELVSHQRMFVKHDPGDLPHVLDVHWRVVNVQRYASTLTFGMLAPDSVPIPALGRSARAPGNLHALLLACLHRFAHHYEKNRLLWLYDIHLLSQSMSDAEWEGALRLAEERAIAPLCGRAIQATRDRFGTQIPSPVAAAFDSAIRNETSMVPEQRWQILLSDLRVLPDWRTRFRLLAEHAFPSPDYVMNKYRRTARWVLPVDYLRRAVTGLRKLTQPVDPEGPAKASR